MAEANLTLTLSKPVRIQTGEVFDSLTLRELTVAENVALEKQAAGKGTLEQDVSFFAMSCGVSPDVILGMGQRDWTRLKNRYWETLGNVAPEGETSA